MNHKRSRATPSPWRPSSRSPGSSSPRLPPAGPAYPMQATPTRPSASDWRSSTPEWSSPRNSPTSLLPPVGPADPLTRGELLLKSLFKKQFQVIESLRVKVDEQGQMLAALMGRDQSPAAARPPNPSLPNGFDFPISSQEEFETLNTHLGDATAKSNLVTYLTTIGGKEVYDSTKRILKRLMTDALQPNWPEEEEVLQRQGFVGRNH